MIALWFSCGATSADVIKAAFSGDFKHFEYDPFRWGGIFPFYDRGEG